MSRQTILDALHRGLAAEPLDVPAAPDRPAAAPLGPDPWAVLAERLAPLDVRLRLAATPAEAAAHAADIARELGATSYARWTDMPPELATALDAALSGLERHDPACCQSLAQTSLGITTAHAALLESGSLALAAGPGRERSVSLLPPAHCCLVPRSALAPDVAALPALLARFADDQGRPPACLNLVTGPSSTADIELVLVRGVHGPGSLHLVCLDWA